MVWTEAVETGRPECAVFDEEPVCDEFGRMLLYNSGQYGLSPDGERFRELKDLGETRQPGAPRFG